MFGQIYEAPYCMSFELITQEHEPGGEFFITQAADLSY